MTMTSPDTVNVATLRVDAIDAKPQHVADWSFHGEDDSENTYTEAVRLSHLGIDLAAMPGIGDETTVVCENGSVTGWTARDEDGDEIEHYDMPDAWREAAEEHCDGPMMNYWYPLDLDNETAAALAIVDLPLCVVTVNGQTGLALTGGGMDLSWEVAYAHVLCGFLPPVHFANLPAMAGPRPAWYRIAAEAMVRSCEIAQRWMAGRADDAARALAYATSSD